VLPHRVPLTDAALGTLARAYTLATGVTAKPGDLPRLTPLMRDALIVPSAKRDTPLSDMALSAVVRRMNADRPEDAPPPWRDPDGREAVPHGFRATFSTWVDDTRPEEHEAAEKALAHEVGNKVSGAYRRSDLFDRRLPLMRDWAAHCEGAKAARAQGRIAFRFRELMSGVDFRDDPDTRATFPDINSPKAKDAMRQWREYKARVAYGGKPLEADAAARLVPHALSSTRPGFNAFRLLATRRLAAQADIEEMVAREKGLSPMDARYAAMRTLGLSDERSYRRLKAVRTRRRGKHNR
jgi:hypothetical protein